MEGHVGTGGIESAPLGETEQARMGAERECWQRDRVRMIRRRRRRRSGLG